MPNIIEAADAAANANTAYALGIGQTARGRVALGGDHDWFAVDLVAGETYTFAMTGTGVNEVSDTVLALYGSDGQTLLHQDDDGFTELSSWFTFTATETATHYLEATAIDEVMTGQYGVSATLGTRAILDIDMGAGAVDGSESWGTVPGAPPPVIAYGFRLSDAPYTVDGSVIATFSQLSDEEIAAVEACLGLIAEVSGVTFRRINPAGYTDKATILLANYFDPNDGAGAFAFGPGSRAAAANNGDVWLNTGSVSTTDLPPGSYSFATILHELMHSLGFPHPGVYNADPDINITYEEFAQFTNDSEQFSILSYFDADATGAVVPESPETLMLYDILAIQNQYGANSATRAGGTTYGFGSTAGGTYDFDLNDTPVFCIWDGGGADILDASGFAMKQVIDLNEGGFSDIGGYVKNIAIAIGAVIEDALGGAGADSIVGNGAANMLDGGGGADVLSGGGGADHLAGGAGSDLASYAGAKALVRVALDSSIGFAGDALGDSFASIERLAGSSFNDTLAGDARSNVILGGAGADIIMGKAGHDTLRGEAGADRLTGGLGNDRFMFTSPGQGRDVVTDFHNAPGGNDTFAFHGSSIRQPITLGQ